jgi:uncharacterized protein (TIGR01777 family)
MRIVVNGGSGLIGRRLVEELTAKGHEVRVLSRDPARVEGLPDGVEVESWNAESASDLAPLLAGGDAVVHLAGANIGEGRWTERRKRLIVDSRVRSSAAVAEALAAADAPRVLIQASAVGYYGARADEELTEEAPPGDDFLARTCREWEAASAPAEAAGVRRVIARTGVVLTMEGGALPKMALPFKLFAGGPAGNGRQWMPWIHLEDEVAALVFLVENQTARGPFNLAAPQPATNRELSRALGRALGRPSFMPAPAFALRIALGEMATLVLDGQRAVPRALLDLGFTFRYPRVEQALAAIFG